MSKQQKNQPERSRVKVLRFPDTSSVAQPQKQTGIDMLAESIRKSWLEKKPRTA
jgi:hypothetical protein